MISKKELTINILKNLNRNWSELIKRKHGSAREILLGDLIEAVLEAETGIGSCNILKISPQTFNRTIKKSFTEVKLSGGGQSWYNFLLNISDYKRCNGCRIYLLKSEFNKDISTFDNLCASCISCRKEISKSYYKNNREYFDNYLKYNRAEHNARNAKRRAAKIKRTPEWASLEVIKEIYKNCPKDHHVDHIIPLQGKIVSGLHVENNLQYLTAEENLKKGNRYKPE